MCPQEIRETCASPATYTDQIVMRPIETWNPAVSSLADGTARATMNAANKTLVLTRFALPLCRRNMSSIMHSFSSKISIIHTKQKAIKQKKNDRILHYFSLTLQRRYYIEELEELPATAATEHATCNSCNTSSHSQTSRLLTSSLCLGVPVPRPTQCMRDA